MPTLHAGYVVCRKCHGHGDWKDKRGDVHDCGPCRGAGRTEEFYRIDVTDGQMRTLGFAHGEKPHRLKLGCGMDACAYEVPASDADRYGRVVKVTKDRRDAVIAEAIRGLDPQPTWAIPVYGVYRLPGEAYVLVLAKAEVPLPSEWSDPIEEVFADTANERKWGRGGLHADEWGSRFGYEGWIRNIELANISKGENEVRRKLRRALDTINEMILALRRIGLDGSDFHPGNWGIYQGRPVIIDFGMARLKDRKGQILSPEVDVQIPDPKQLPVLPFSP